MRYKVKDKVRVRKDLEVGKKYDNCLFVSHMGAYRGKIVEISKVDRNWYYIKGDLFLWSEEMFEPVMTNFDKVREEIRIDEIGNSPICKAIHRMRKEIGCFDIKCDECKEWLKQPYEESKEILDKQEKEYLSAVIKPFRDRVNYIIKMSGGSGEYIGIYITDDVAFLPHFKKKSMYKGMELDRKYTLEELGL